MFDGLKFYLLPEGIIKARKTILEGQIAKNGGTLAKSVEDSDLKFVLVDDDLDVKRISKLVPINKINSWSDALKMLRTKWLSKCIKQKQFIEELDAFEVNLDELRQSAVKKNVEGVKLSVPFASESSKHVDEKKKCEIEDVYDMPTESSDSDSAQVESAMPPPAKKKGRFVCEIPSPAVDPNQNKLITDKLQILAEGYKSTKDRWRALSYEKAINVLKHHPEAVTSRQEVKKLRGIGDRIAEKIVEIIESGELRKADAFASNEKLNVMNLFNNIWGVGPTIADQWFVQGMRTLEDVRTKAKLTYQQAIGLKYYHELMQRIPRSEAVEIVETVVSATKEINADFICQACGSYRRGNATCGDVDILITHPDNQSHDNVLPIVVQNLTNSGFLTDHLVECSIDGNHKKYMGVCKLPGDDKLHRRLDIISVPYDEYPTALIYFTGSAHFVRSINSKAKSMGMRLNAHGLRGGVMRQHGEKLNDGYLIETPSEKSVFEKLGLEYQTPEERDHP